MRLVVLMSPHGNAYMRSHIFFYVFMRLLLCTRNNEYVRAGVVVLKRHDSARNVHVDMRDNAFAVCFTI